MGHVLIYIGTHNWHALPSTFQKQQGVNEDLLSDTLQQSHGTART